MSATSEINFSHSDANFEHLYRIFTLQKKAFSHQPMSDLNSRIKWLRSLKKALLLNKEALIEAMSQDFGYRSDYDSLIGDILPVVRQINYTLKNLKKWLKPAKRHSGLLLAPATVRVEYQPKGVVGIIAPWNFPVMLSLSPLVTSIAAGNNTMLKVSEFTPQTNRVLIALLESVFPQQLVHVIEGAADVATEFTSLPFDHMLFTGSTPIGKHVMRAAAENLTPVTLELGGKSPVLIADDISLDVAVERIIYGKSLNAGQICVSPDYILCPEDKVAALLKSYRAKFQTLYPNFDSNPDYSHIVNERQAQRLEAVLLDAVEKGADIFCADRNSGANEGKLPDSSQRKWPTQLITGTTTEMRVMNEEIFGPLLPIVPYRELQQAINFINARPRPLALYLMSFDKSVQQRVISQTHSGSVCINETVSHVAAEDVPFGGIGESGIGHYHGIEGFKTFSHAKTVLQRGKINSGKLLHPPYGGQFQELVLKFFVK